MVSLANNNGEHNWKFLSIAKLHLQPVIVGPDSPPLPTGVMRCMYSLLSRLEIMEVKRPASRLLT